MDYKYDFSIIIPQRNSLKTLSKLLSSIPKSDRIEIIVVDNSPSPVSSDMIHTDRDFKLAWSHPDRHAGGARNVGVSISTGKWLIFADADDFFSPNAFDLFYQYLNSSSDIIYFKVDGVYIDTLEHSDRAEIYNCYIEKYIQNGQDIDLRYKWHVPWGKMISREFVQKNNLAYDEIRAGNDAYFSLTCGHYAQSIEVCNNVGYFVTTSANSLTQKKDYDIIKARLYSRLHCNQFVRGVGLPELQQSVIYPLYECRRFGIKFFIEFVSMIIEFRQNPLIGYKNWLKTFWTIK